jgi:tetratricopeptide (TPR) repeat protein
MQDENMVAFLEYGYGIATKHNMTSRMANFLVALIKEDYSNADTAERAFQLSQIMTKLKKNEVAMVLNHGLNSNFADFEKKSELNLDLPEGINTVDELIADLGAKIFDAPDNTGINRAASLSYVDACEAYALINPNNPNSPDNLFKAAEVAKSLRTFPKSLSLYDWIIDSYPDYEKTATSLFLKGFIIENNLGDDEKARQVYNEFTERFPDHELADDVQFLIENLGKTDEEILEMIEQRRKENQTES